MRLVVVTGSRAWTDRDPIISALSHARARGPRGFLMHGACRGLDGMAGDIAEGDGWHVMPVPAQWHTLGNRAGPERNRRMMQMAQSLKAHAWSVDVYAFPLGRSRGTRHAMREAWERGLPVWLVVEDGTIQRWQQDQ